MKSKKNIVFLGMMGSGKSSIGRLISKKLKLDFFDIDENIEKNLKMKISKIFNEKGENFFRKYEEKLTLDILKKDNIVISLGGGAFLNRIIRKEVLLNHLSFWLKWDSQVLATRIESSSKRPLVFNLTKNDLVIMSEKRSNIYSKAMYTIDCNNLTKDEIVSKVINKYEPN